MCCWLSVLMALACQKKTTSGKPLTFNKLHLTEQLFSKTMAKKWVVCLHFYFSIHKSVVLTYSFAEGKYLLS